MTESSNTPRILHNLGLATWFGGGLFGQVALNPTVERISDKAERGRVLNESWGRFNALNAAAIASAVLAWRFGGLKADAELRAPGLMRVKDLLLGGAVFNGVMSGVLGARIASEGPEGYTPVESGTEPAPETPEAAAKAARWIHFFGTGALVCLAAAIAVTTKIEASHPKPLGLLSRLLSD